MDVMRTTNEHPDFIKLTQMLDADLKDRYGALQSYYDQHNVIDPIDTAIVGYVDKKAVACGCFKPINANTIEIKRMFVDPEYRRQGRSIRILKELETWGIERRYRHAILETGKGQPEAIALYTTCGYEITPNYGPYKNMENSVCMKKELPFPGPFTI